LRTRLLGECAIGAKKKTQNGERSHFIRRKPSCRGLREAVRRMHTGRKTIARFISLKVEGGENKRKKGGIASKKNNRLE